MTDEQYLVCPACRHAELATTGAEACPKCDSTRTYLHHAPAWPDATSESYVKLDDEAVESGDED